MPAPHEKVLPIQDEPVRYSAGPGQSSYSDDAVVKLLVREYGVPPEHAVALAPQLIGEKNNPYVSQAMGMVAEREAQRLRLMKRYQDLKQAEQDGTDIDPADRTWMQRVDAKRDAVLKRDAEAAYTRQQASKEPIKPAPERPTPPEVSTMRSFRPGMTIHPDGKGLSIPVKQPEEHPLLRTAKSIMGSFGADPASAALLASKLHGG